MKLPRRRHFATFVVVVVVASGCTTTTTAAVIDKRPQPSPSPAYYSHFLHDPRIGTAFLPSASSDDRTNETHQDDVDFSSWSINLDEATLPNTNPVPAYLRHPLVSQQKPTLTKNARVPMNRRDVVSADDVQVPYPPSGWIDINNLTTIALLAEATVARMQTWYEDGLFEWTAWWQTPVLGIAYVNLDLALGNNANQLLATDVLVKNDALGWMIDKYIDDQSWWAMFALRAYQAYANETWLTMSETISNNNTLYWDDTCHGGVLWLTYRPKIKNTITNGLYFSTLTRLYRLTGNTTHLEYATNTLNWWLGWAFESTTGRVYDTITAPDCNVTGLQTWTYNSGAFLYGLADLYYATGNETVLDLGRSIAYAAIRDFTDQSTGVLVESCEHDPQPDPTLPPGCQQDEVVFKGILLMGMAELYLARPDPNIYNFINTQLLSATFNDVDDTWLFGEWWNGPWNETTAGPKTQVNALCLLSAAALVNRDFLSKAGQDVTLQGSVASNEIGVPSNLSASGDAGTTNRPASDNISPSSALSLLHSSSSLFLSFLFSMFSLLYII